MRSGTHLLIDLILNNFAAYRHAPLYIDADAWFRSVVSPHELVQAQGCVVKTHFPQLQPAVGSEIPGSVLEQLAQSAVVFQPRRDSAAVFRSLQQFGYRGDDAAFVREAKAFGEFWHRFEPLQLDFDALADPKASARCLQQVAEAIDQPMPQAPVLTPPKSRPWSILYWKAMTRLLGRRARRINTSIQLGTASRS